MIEHPSCRVLAVATCMAPAQRLALTTIGVRDDLAAAPTVAHRQRMQDGASATAVIHCASPWSGAESADWHYGPRAHRRRGPASRSLPAAHEARTTVSSASACVALAVGRSTTPEMISSSLGAHRDGAVGAALLGLRVAKPATCRRRHGERNFWRFGASHRRTVGSRRASEIAAERIAVARPEASKPGRGAAARRFAAALHGHAAASVLQVIGVP